MESKLWFFQWSCMSVRVGLWRKLSAEELCFWAVVLRKTLESPLDSKEIKPVNPKGNQSWIFIGKTDAEAEAPILWPPNVKDWLIWKDPDPGNDWRQEEKGTTKDEIVGWCHRLDGHEFEQALGVGEGQGSLACCIPWGHKESDMTEWLNWLTADGCWGLGHTRMLFGTPEPGMGQGQNRSSKNMWWILIGSIASIHWWLDGRVGGRMDGWNSGFFLLDGSYPLHSLFSQLVCWLAYSFHFNSMSCLLEPRLKAIREAGAEDEMVR